MKRLGLAVAVVAVAVIVAPAVAWGQPTPLCNGQPNCSHGWYTSPVTVSWDLNGGTNAGGCAAQTYNQDINESNWPQNPATLPPWAYCITNVSGGSDTRYFFIEVELSSPTASIAPSRPPDSAGWYNHTVTAAVNATAFSGIGSCTPTSYAGPDTTTATLSTTCTDYAGKTVTATSSPFAYDATAPSLSATASSGDRTVSLSWQAGGDVAPIAAIQVVRSPGPAGAAGDPVYNGTASGFQDNSVQDGVQYTYSVTAVDQAGNRSTQTITAMPQARLIAPVNSAHLASPPLLSWTPVRGATYYNVQVYRNGKKILSSWPTTAQLQLQRSWRYHGRRYKLKPGRYRWFVWPGLGKRRAARYGHRIGSWTFVVAR